MQEWLHWPLYIAIIVVTVTKESLDSARSSWPYQRCCVSTASAVGRSDSHPILLSRLSLLFSSCWWSCLTLIALSVELTPYYYHYSVACAVLLCMTHTLSPLSWSPSHSVPSVCPSCSISSLAAICVRQPGAFFDSANYQARLTGLLSLPPSV